MERCREDGAHLSQVNTVDDSQNSFVELELGKSLPVDSRDSQNAQIRDAEKSCIRKLDDVTDSENESAEDIADIFGDDWLGKPGVSTSSESEDVPMEETATQTKKRRVRGGPIPSNITVIEGDPTRYKCIVCVKTFSSKGHIRYHAYCAQNDKPFKCHLCSKSFSKKNVLDYHIKTHTGEKPFTCLMCDKSFVQLNKLNRHKRIHFGNNVECDECKEKFRDVYSLNLHKRTHSNTDLYIFKCDSCSKSFKDKSTLNKHVRGVHSVSKQFFCEHCGKGFDWKYNLICHIRTHFGVRAYSCTECKRTFKNYNDCYKHRLTHTDEREYKCNVCEGSFKRRDNLVRHLRNIHPEQDPSKIVRIQSITKSVPTSDRKSSVGVISQNVKKMDKNAGGKSSSKEEVNVIESPRVINGPVGSHSSSDPSPTKTFSSDPMTSSPSTIVFNKTSRVIRESDRISNDYNRTPDESSRTPSTPNRIPHYSSVNVNESNRIGCESETIPSDYSRVPTESSRIPGNSSIISESGNCSRDPKIIVNNISCVINETRRSLLSEPNLIDYSRSNLELNNFSNESNRTSSNSSSAETSRLPTSYDTPEPHRTQNDFHAIPYSSNIIFSHSSRDLYEGMRVPSSFSNAFIGELNRLDDDFDVFALDNNANVDANRISVIRNLSPSPSSAQSSVIKHSGTNSTSRHVSLTPPSPVRECVIKSTKQ